MLMIIFHIVVAVVSLILSAYVAFRPQQLLLKVNYGLISTTLVTGVVLIMNGASVWHMCMSGFVYCLFAIGLAEVARRRLGASSTTL